MKVESLERDLSVEHVVVEVPSRDQLASLVFLLNYKAIWADLDSLSSKSWTLTVLDRAQRLTAIVVDQADRQI